MLISLCDIAIIKCTRVCIINIIIEEPKAPCAADKSNSKAYTTVVTSVLTISELVALLLDLGCCFIGQMVGPHA